MHQCKKVPTGDYLKPGIIFAILHKVALEISDNEAADRIKQAHQKQLNNMAESKSRQALLSNSFMNWKIPVYNEK